jgi:4-hydroxy-4-methyl-2-oxoglutarate aldolase
MKENSVIHVKTNIERPDADAVRRLAQFSSATIHEAQGRKGALSSKIKPIDRSMSFCGPATTVRCAPRDNLMLQVAIPYAEAGDVVLAAAGEYEDAGTFGDVLGNAMKAKGLAGLVTESGVRDNHDLI